MTDAPAHASVFAKVRRKRGLPINPMVWGPSPPPFVDESLLGLIARTAARNGFTSINRVLSLADIDCRKVSSLPSRQEASVRNLALLLRVDETTVASRMHLEWKRPGRRICYISFHGSVIRARHRENRIRRVSPRSLQASPYHRASWDLRPFSFCVDSWEQLLTRCPGCECTLGWTSTSGIPYCERCLDENGRPRIDLRNFPQPLVSVSDEAALSFACDIVHPDPTRRDRARRALAPDFSNVPPGDLLDVIVLMGRIATTETDASGNALRRFSMVEYPRLTPDILAKAARTMMTWPSTFLDLAEEQRLRVASVPGIAGTVKEMGGLQWLAWDPDLPDVIKTIFSRGNAAFVERLETRTAGWAKYRRKFNPEGYIARKQAARLLGATPAQMAAFTARPEVDSLRFNLSKNNIRTGLILYKADQIAAIKHVRLDLIRTSTAAVRLGIPLWAVEELCRIGRLTEETGPAVALGSGVPMLRASSFEALMTALRERILPYDGRVPDDPPLIKVVSRAARLDMPWIELIEAVLDGTLALRFPGKARKNGFTANVCLVDPAQLDRLDARRHPGDDVASSTPLTDVEASVVIGAKSSLVYKLVDAGLLKTNGASERRIRIEDLSNFKALYALTPEVARLLRTKGSDVRKNLARIGVHPVAALTDNRDLIWRRQDLLRV